MPEDGRIVGIDAHFYSKGHILEGKDGGKLKFAYRTIDVPPLHTNCHCFVRPDTIELF